MNEDDAQGEVQQSFKNTYDDDRTVSIDSYRHGGSHLIGCTEEQSNAKNSQDRAGQARILVAHP